MDWVLHLIFMTQLPVARTHIFPCSRALQHASICLEYFLSWFQIPGNFRRPLNVKCSGKLHNEVLSASSSEPITCTSFSRTVSTQLIFQKSNNAFRSNISYRTTDHVFRISIYEGVSKIFRTDAVKVINLTTKRVWKLPTSTLLRATWHTDSLEMVVLPSTGASRYSNCCIDGGTSPEYFGYTLVLVLQELSKTNKILNKTATLFVRNVHKSDSRLRQMHSRVPWWFSPRQNIETAPEFCDFDLPPCHMLQAAFHVSVTDRKPQCRQRHLLLV
jgi:hypothetical protein